MKPLRCAAIQVFECRHQPQRSAGSIFPSSSIKTILNRGAHKDNTPEAIKFLMSLTHPMHKKDPCSSLQSRYPDKDYEHDGVLA